DGRDGVGGEQVGEVVEQGLVCGGGLGGGEGVGGSGEFGGGEGQVVELDLFFVEVAGEGGCGLV
ncbi:MAG: hypothetical protein ACNA7W_22265, partial [Pseudomonadales bacterium]